VKTGHAGLKVFLKAESKFKPQAQGKSHRILWVEATAFSLIIVLSWLTEAIRIPHLIYGEAFTPNWHRAIIRTVVIVLIWIWVHLATRQLLKRLHYLEEFLRVCSWCRKVSSGHEWIDMERYLNSKFATKTSHGMCPDCLRKKKDEIASGDKATTTV
jgi:hypothetical protein